MSKKLLLAASAVAYWFSRREVLKIFKRFDKRLTPVVLEIPHVNVSFKSNGQQLVGNLFGTNKKGLVIFAHGLGLGSDDYYMITKALAQNGYQVLAYDATGTFRSEGPSTVGINQSVVDLRSALDFVMSHKELEYDKLYLVGHSWGGYAVAAILNEKKYPVDKVVSLGASNSAFELMYYNVEHPAERLMLPFTSLYHILAFGKDFFYTAVSGLNKSNVPALIVHGTKDEQIDIKTTSIVAHRNKIKNPNVEYFIRDDEGNNGHNSIFEDVDDAKKIDPDLLNRILNFFEDS